MCSCSQNNQHKSLLSQAELKFLCTDSESQEVMENPTIMAIPMTTLSDLTSCLSLCSSSVDRSLNAAATAALLSAVIQTHTQASIVWVGEPRLTSWRYWRVFFREKYGRHGGEANICWQLFVPNLSSLSIHCLIWHFYVKTTKIFHFKKTEVLL